MQIAIQAILSRADSVERIQARLPQARVSWDTGMHGTLWSMEKIFADSDPLQPLLILQDDVSIPEWFEEELAECIFPTRVMSFFMGMSKFLKVEYDKGNSYAETRNVWGQANYFPVGFIPRYQAWAAKQTGRLRNGDDTELNRFYRHAGIWSLLTIPNIVNHLQVKSSMGHTRRPQGKARVSGLFGKEYLRPWNKDAIGRLPK